MSPKVWAQVSRQRDDARRIEYAAQTREVDRAFGGVLSLFSFGQIVPARRTFLVHFIYLFVSFFPPRELSREAEF